MFRVSVSLLSRGAVSRRPYPRRDVVALASLTGLWGCAVKELMTNCHHLGFLAFRRVLSRSLGLAACRTRYASPLQLRFRPLARCGRLAFPVAVEVKLPNCMTLGKNKIAKLSVLG